MKPYHYYQLLPCKNHAIGVVFCMLAPGGSNRSKRKTTFCTSQWVCPHKCRHQFRKLPSAHLLHRYRFSVPASVAQISHCEAIYRFPRRGKYHGCFFLAALKRNRAILKNDRTVWGRRICGFFIAFANSIQNPIWSNRGIWVLNIGICRLRPVFSSGILKTNLSNRNRLSK